MTSRQTLNKRAFFPQKPQLAPPKTPDVKQKPTLTDSSTGLPATRIDVY
jgi:hypothetical protein